MTKLNRFTDRDTVKDLLIKVLCTLSCRENFDIVICANFFITLLAICKLVVISVSGRGAFLRLVPSSYSIFLDWIVSKRKRSGWRGTRGEL